jgi:hypothetical protein
MSVSVGSGTLPPDHPFGQLELPGRTVEAELPQERLEVLETGVDRAAVRKADIEHLRREL